MSSVQPSFQGLRVLSLESRRAREIGALIETYGGRADVAPALREVPLADNPDALAFADGLLRGNFDIVILLTGVGTRALLDVVEQKHARDAFIGALARVKVVARGPKPLAVLREWNVPVWVAAPEPNTWREVLAALDAEMGRLKSAPTSESVVGAGFSRPGTLAGQRIAVQEYGAANPDLLQGLEDRGAIVTRVPVYRWALPEDTGPLKDAARAVAGGDIDLAIFTTATQVVHLLQVAAGMGIERDVRQGLARMVVASIGPTTSEELRQQGIQVDMEASHPKMGFLVREAAERSAELVQAKHP
jgi:uroporphyrinogen-III synthase